MAFNINDIYTSSGSVQLYNAWTPYVSKFDTSSFYNWEQDNLPLYDLEERTYELWEQQGFPTSSITGLSLTVSADAPAATLLADNTVFTDLSSCMAAIPKVVRFPVLVEVCNFGDLGSLELHNVKIEEGGSIEIINRGFGRTHALSSTVESTWAANNTDLPRNFSHKLAKSVSSFDMSATLSGTSGVHISTPVVSATNDSRLTKLNSVLFLRGSSRLGALTVGIENDLTLNTTATEEFFISPLEREAVLVDDSTLPTDDVSATRQYNDTALARQGVSDGDQASFNVYTNKLDSISVKNCDSPIYIRNFFVDGDHARDNAIEISNSDVVLENCTAIRSKEAGFKFNNSKCVLSRSAASYRNYTLTNNTTRAAETGIGFHAVNSHLQLSSVPLVTGSTSVGDVGASGMDVNFAASRNYVGYKLENSTLKGGFQRQVATSENTGGSIVAELNTGYGIQATNSELDVDGLLDVYGNSKGIELHGSRMVMEDMTVDRHSNEGLRCFDSVIQLDSEADPTDAGQAGSYQVDFIYNSQDLVLRKGSSFTFRRKNDSDVLFGNSAFRYAHGAVKWLGSTQAVLPSISVEDGSNADLIHPYIFPRENSLTLNNKPCYGMGIRAVNNSTATMYGSKTGCNLIFGPNDYPKQRFVAGAYAGHNSVLNFHGPTAIAQFGVDALAENNSTINICPPKARGSWGYEASAFNLDNVENHTSVELHSTRACLVANKNSVINMADLGAYNGFWNNSTVGQGYMSAGNDLDLETQDLSGIISNGSIQFFPNPQDETLVTSNNLDDIQNAGISFNLGNFPRFTATTSANTFFVVDTVVNGTPEFTKRGKISRGGVCVRATEDSEVNVRNVHFLHGNQNSPLDGMYYSPDTNLCERLMIWNMADTSRLNAAFCCVSGTYPQSASYYGPSALWVSSDGGTGYRVASGAPESTPDTGTLSVLDTFGAGSGVYTVPVGLGVNDPFDRYYIFSGGINDSMNEELDKAGVNVSGTTAARVYGSSPGTNKNRGVFRIYWGVDPAANYLATDLSGYKYGGNSPGNFSGILGIAPQIYAQGYNMSANVSATVLSNGASPSGTYPQLLKYSYDSDGDGFREDLWTSGFYYCKEFVEDNPTQCILDESAANTFANAKNASIGQSGRPKKVTIIKSGAATNAANIGSEANPGETVLIEGVSKFGTEGFKSSNVFDLERDN